MYSMCIYIVAKHQKCTLIQKNVVWHVTVITHSEEQVFNSAKLKIAAKETFSFVMFKH